MDLIPAILFHIVHLLFEEDIGEHGSDRGEDRRGDRSDRHPSARRRGGDHCINNGQQNGTRFPCDRCGGGYDL